MALTDYHSRVKTRGHQKEKIQVPGTKGILLMFLGLTIFLDNYLLSWLFITGSTPMTPFTPRTLLGSQEWMNAYLLF